MKILVTGCDGQVGWELERLLLPLADVIATSRATLDLADSDAIRRLIRDVKPAAIVNGAAYTAVDRAESEPQVAMQVNGVAPGIIAEEAKRAGSLLVHYSTDYVFDGKKPSEYTEEDSPNPLNVYGLTKLAGERAITATGCRHITLRTSWVYAKRGRNFLLTILRLARAKNHLDIVDDQRGAPTWARDIAQATVKLLCSADPPAGLYHLTARGSTTWFGFAREVIRFAQTDVTVKAVSSKEYRTVAARPANSVLSNAKLTQATGIVLPEWSLSLRACMEELSHELGPAAPSLS